MGFIRLRCSERWLGSAPAQHNSLRQLIVKQPRLAELALTDSVQNALPDADTLRAFFGKHGGEQLLDVVLIQCNPGRLGGIRTDQTDLRFVKSGARCCAVSAFR